MQSQQISTKNSSIFVEIGGKISAFFDISMNISINLDFRALTLHWWIRSCAIYTPLCSATNKIEQKLIKINWLKCFLFFLTIFSLSLLFFIFGSRVFDQPCFFSFAEKQIFTMSKPTRKSAGRGQTTPWQVVAVILDWLEVPKIFDLVPSMDELNLIWRGWKSEPS